MHVPALTTIPVCATIMLSLAVASAHAEQRDESTQMADYYRSCLRVMLLQAPQAERVCACAAGVYTFAFAKHYSEIEASRVAQDCYPALKNEQ